MLKGPRPPAFWLLLQGRAGVDAVVVFRLQSVLLALHLDGRRVKAQKRTAGSKGQEGTLISDFFAKETIVQAVPPSVSVGIGDGLDQFVGKYIVG